MVVGVTGVLAAVTTVPLLSTIETLAIYGVQASPALFWPVHVPVLAVVCVPPSAVVTALDVFTPKAVTVLTPRRVAVLPDVIFTSPVSTSQAVSANKAVSVVLRMSAFLVTAAVVVTMYEVGNAPNSS